MAATNLEPLVVDFAEACRLLAMSPSALRREMHAGNINASAHGRKPVFHTSEIRRYAEDLKSWQPRS